jgi:hypothetical protein
MARLGRRRVSRLSVIIIGVFASAFAILIWGCTRPLPEYLIAQSQLGYGSALAASDLEVVRLDLGELSDLYLTPGDLTGDLVSIRPVASGELVPKSAVGNQIQSGFSVVTVTPSQLPSAEIGVGTKVELWVVPELQNSMWEPATSLGYAEVVAVVEPEGVFAEDTGTYELLVPNENLKAILEAVAIGHPMFLVQGGL